MKRTTIVLQFVLTTFTLKEHIVQYNINELLMSGFTKHEFQIMYHESNSNATTDPNLT